MEKYANSELDYRVTRANKEQMEWIFNKHWGNIEERQKARERHEIVFVAIDENENIIGRLMIHEKPVPPPLNGTNWWINNIHTNMEYRRNGVATAMLKETIKQAEQIGVHHLQGMAEATRHANMFWFKNGFSLQKCFKKCDDESKPENYGYYQRVMFYRINRTVKTNIVNNTEYKIIRADKEQMECIFNEYLLNETINHLLNERPNLAKYYEDKKEDFFALTAVDTEKKMVGFIIAFAEELISPLDGTEWIVPYIFVFPELRRQGIGSVLVHEMSKTAKEAQTAQLLFISIKEESVEFWDKNNLDLFFWKYLSTQNTIITAGLRIL